MANNPNSVAVNAINAAAQKYGLDPKAMIAVARVESGLNPAAVGDGGHAFGLFQFNNAGGTITGQPNPQRYLDPNFNAMEAARHIASIPGARGAKGQKAINLIVNQFERPANKTGEIAKASQFYGQLSPDGLAKAAAYSNIINGSSGASVTSPKTSLASSQGAGSSGGYDPSQALTAYLMNQSVPGHTAQDPTSELMTLLQNNQAALTVEHSSGTKTIPIDRTSTTPVDPAEAKVVSDAKQYLGVKYKWGGANPKSGFDCSGFVQYVQNINGVKIPRTTYQQLKTGQVVAKGDLQPGDAVFFHNGSHEGMYIGNGKFIQAPHTGDVVKISDLNTYPGFYTARRFGK